MGGKDKKGDDSLAPDADNPWKTDRRQSDEPSEQKPLSRTAKRFLSGRWQPPAAKPTRNVDIEETTRAGSKPPEADEEHPQWIKRSATARRQITPPTTARFNATLHSLRTKLGMTKPDFETALRNFLDSSTGSNVSLPKRAPELWSDRGTSDSRESPTEFVRRVYARWLGCGLTRAHVRQLDLPLYRALSAWMSRHPEDDLSELPSLSESIDQKVARLSAEFTEDELRKLGLALQNRARRL